MEKDSGLWQEYRQLMEQKQKLLSDMLGLALSQERMIEQDDIQGLRESMQRRDEIATCVDRMDFRAAGLKRRLKAQGGDAVGLAQAESELVKLIGKIQSADQISSAMLQEKIVQYQNHIRRMRLARKGTDHYTKEYSSLDGVFFDMKK